MKVKLDPDVYERAAEDMCLSGGLCCCRIADAVGNNGYDPTEPYTVLFMSLFHTQPAEGVGWWPSPITLPDEPRTLALLLCAEIVRSYHGKPIRLIQ